MKAVLALAMAAGIALSPTAALPQSKSCPPGLAKKNPPCVPPGQAKKGVTAREWRSGERDDDHEHEVERERVAYVVGPNGRVYRVGDVIERRDVIVIGPDGLVRLPPLEDGRAYVRLDDKVIEVVEAGNLFVRTVGAVSDLLN